METSELRESLADLEHDRWARWMKYMFSCGQFQPDGAWLMPPDKAERWLHQEATDYADLSEREKDRDRAEADNTLAILARFIPGALG